MKYSRLFPTNDFGRYTLGATCWFLWEQMRYVHSDDVYDLRMDQPIGTFFLTTVSRADGITLGDIQSVVTPRNNRLKGL